MSDSDVSTQPTPNRFKTNSLLASGRTADADVDARDRECTRSLSDSEIYGLLKSPRRRFVLWYLDGTTNPVPLGELAEEMAAWENDEPVAAVTSAERKRTYVALYQCHLPKLDTVGVVTFDEDRKRVALGPNYDVLERVLTPKTASTDGPSLAPYYLGLALVTIAALSGSVAVSMPLDGLVLGVVLVSVGSFATLAAWECYRSLEDVAARSWSLWKRVL